MASIHVFGDVLEIDSTAKADFVDTVKLLENLKSLSLICCGCQVASYVSSQGLV